MVHILSLSLIFILGFYAESSFARKSITITSDVWCPYTCEDQSRDRGFMIDAASAILREYGFDVKYRTDSWSKSLQGVLEGRYDAVIGAGQSEARDLVIAYEPLGINKTCFFTPSKSKLDYKGISSIQGKRLGVISGYVYEGEIDNYIETNRARFPLIQMATGNNPLLQNINKIQHDRLDVMIENEVVMNYSQRKYSFAPLRNAGCEKETAPYIAFSPKRDDASRLAEYINVGMTQLRKNGQLKQILSRYGVNDWK